jgi:signal transduction histidine kinase
MGERVLVVEDNRALAENITEILTEEGYEVLACQGPDQLDPALSGRGFDLALVDIGLHGDVSGFELVPKLRRAGPLSEIVLMTGNASLHTAMEAIRSGVHAYLPKPFDSEALLTIVRRALAQVALKKERQALAERLALSESLYRGVVETVETCIVGIDAAGVITFANRFATQRIGPSAGMLTGCALHDLSDERGARAIAQALRRSRAGQPVRDLDVLHNTATGPRTVRWSFTPLHATEARLARRALEGQLELPSATLLGLGQDITDRLELERRSAASHAMAAIGALTTNLAHEIRNPLNAAKLQLEIIRRRAKRSADAELAALLSEPAELVRAELDRVTTMLDEFLSLARPSMPVKARHAVAGLFDAVLVVEAAEANRVGVRLRSELADPGLSVSCDPDKLKQVLLNLVRNSIDALSEQGHGEVVLRGERIADEVVLSVLDDGPGVKSEMMGSAAFEAFATTKAAGTGLGLSIVQNVVAQHGGRVELDNRSEGGAEARVWLPA